MKSKLMIVFLVVALFVPLKVMADGIGIARGDWWHFKGIFTEEGCIGYCNDWHHEPFCGDGHLDAGEQCDDGNSRDGDGCSANCTIEDNHEIPEFTTIGAGIALLGAGAYAIARRKKE